MRKIMFLMTMVSALLLAGFHLTTFSLCGIVYAEEKPKQQNIELSGADKDFLNQCGVSQADIDIIPQLDKKGKLKIRAMLSLNDKNCEDFLVESFKETRKYFKKFTPPAAESPLPPPGYDRDFLIEAELKDLIETNNRIFDKKFGHEPWYQESEKKK